MSRRPANMSQEEWLRQERSATIKYYCHEDRITPEEFHANYVLVPGSTDDSGQPCTIPTWPTAEDGIWVDRCPVCWVPWRIDALPYLKYKRVDASTYPDGPYQIPPGRHYYSIVIEEIDACPDERFRQRLREHLAHWNWAHLDYHHLDRVLSAGSIRDAGIVLPDSIPDAATIPRWAIQTKTRDPTPDPDDKNVACYTVEITLTQPFRWTLPETENSACGAQTK